MHKKKPKAHQYNVTDGDRFSNDSDYDDPLHKLSKAHERAPNKKTTAHQCIPMGEDDFVNNSDDDISGTSCPKGQGSFE